MKKYYSKFITATFFVALFALGSCSDFLKVDKYFDNELRMDSIFQSTRRLEGYMWGAAARFPDEGALFQGSYTPGPMATDEMFTLQDGYQGMDFVLGYTNAENLSSMGIWGNMYVIIRTCNEVLYGLRQNRIPDMLEKDRTRITAYSRFIRAYAYYNILMNFGPPILLGDDIIPSNEPIEYYDRQRATYDEAVEYICSELDSAGAKMPKEVSIMEFGIPTQGAAYGLVARIRLMHASPLFNGGEAAIRCFSNWKRKNKDETYTPYVSQIYDPTRWAVAAAAARRVMRLKNAGGQIMYELYTIKKDNNTPMLPPKGNDIDDGYDVRNYPDGAADIDPYRSYSDIFTGEAPTTSILANPELVWGRNSLATTNSTRLAFPNTLGGWNGLCLTQKMVDAFLMRDGRTKEEASSDKTSDYEDPTKAPYSETGILGQITHFSGYRLNSTVNRMYVNREARFYVSVGFSEGVWQCLSAEGSAGETNQTITYYYDSKNGKTGPTNPNDYPVTGYVYIKPVHYMDSWSDKATAAKRTEKVFHIIRYAEILLSYAEALNNLGSDMYSVDDPGMESVRNYGLEGSDLIFERNVDEIRSSFNRVRYRAGLPGLTDAQLISRDEVQAQIERERMIEFLGENRRYFDVRRWGKYEDSEREGILGMDTESKQTSFYQRAEPNSARVGQRVINKKMVFLPIPKNEIKRLPSCDQNPGWE
jgi:hypothetical protein